VRRAGLIVATFLGLTICFALAARHLELRTDFKNLLPDGQPSVVALEELMRRVGGLGTLNLAIESTDLRASKRFVEDLVAVIRARLGEDIHSIDYTVAPIRRFYERYGSLYLATGDLRQIDEELAQAIHRAKLRANPLYLELDESPPGAEPATRLANLEARLRDQARGADRFPEGYYIGEKGRLLVLFLRPSSSALEVQGARAFIARMRALVDSLHPRRYHPSLKVGFAGSIQVTVEEHESIVRDLLGTSVLCITLVAFSVWIYFRRLRVLGLLALTLVGGAVWAFGLAALVVGYVNAQTAFLGSIIVGTGINYGIMLLARYLEERRAGADSRLALGVAISTTLKPTLVAAAGTGVAFGSLGIAHIRSFSQFGFIGGVGIMICWLLSYSFLPALLCLFERVSWLRLRIRGRPLFELTYPGWLARLPLRHPWSVTVVATLLVAGSVAVLLPFLPRSLETNINNLRNKSGMRSGTNVLSDRMDNIYGESLNPAIVLASSPDQARRICAAVDQRIRENRKTAPFEYCRSIYSFLPPEQEQKLALLARIRDRLDHTPQDLLPDGVRRRLRELRARLDLGPLRPSDLPEEIRRRFREKNGTEGAMVTVAPRDDLSIWSVEGLFTFTDGLRAIRLDNGEVVRSSGDIVVFADILKIIAVDAPRTTVVAAAGVFLVLFLVLRRGWAVVQVASALTAGVAMMAGLGAALGVKYNFFNFVALPTTFGIGVDYPINIHQRYLQDGPGSLESALRHTGPAVFIASLTTIVGYGVLLTSNSLALVSFGKLAIMGELTCLAAALILLPAFGTLAERRVCHPEHEGWRHAR
jgi:hypothetical protein